MEYPKDPIAKTQNLSYMLGSPPYACIVKNICDTYSMQQNLLFCNTFSLFFFFSFTIFFIFFEWNVAVCRRMSKSVFFCLFSLFYSAGISLWRRPLRRILLLRVSCTVPFSPALPLVEFMAEAFGWLSFWNFKGKSISHFLWHSLPVSPAEKPALAKGPA